MAGESGPSSAEEGRESRQHTGRGRTGALASSGSGGFFLVPLRVRVQLLLNGAKNHKLLIQNRFGQLHVTLATWLNEIIKFSFLNGITFMFF